MLKGIDLLHNLQFNTRIFHSTSPNLKKRISNEERAKFQLDPFLKQVLVGNILPAKHCWGSGCFARRYLLK